MGNVAPGTHVHVFYPDHVEKRFYLWNISHLQQTSQLTSRLQSSVWFLFNAQNCIRWCVLVRGRTGELRLPGWWKRRQRTQYVIYFLGFNYSLRCCIWSLCEPAFPELSRTAHWPFPLGCAQVPEMRELLLSYTLPKRMSPKPETRQSLLSPSTPIAKRWSRSMYCT